jgi:acetolactate synthase-1/3 small subunit
MENNQDKFTVELLVSNQFGVLNRITGLYAKRGYNIDSIYAGETENPEKTRVLITSKGSEYIQSQVVRQLGKLYDVLNVTLMAQISR